MFDFTSGPARVRISATRPDEQEELEQAQSGNRDKLSAQEFEVLQQGGTLIMDTARRRPLYFDGRFLTARDLTRDQNYFLLRQADIGRTRGAGVVSGLLVETSTSTSDIIIRAGHGITTSGEIVVIANDWSLDLEKIAESQALDASFGLIRLPREAARNRSGVFILALRPVEYSANPIASYPTSIEARRTIEDGEIIEAVAATLIPYPDRGAGDALSLRRGRLAREIFVEGVQKGIPSNALPLVMMALERGTIKWLDPFMLRREVGAEHGDILGLGFAPRALREAHLLQYEHHLQEVILSRQNAVFSATDYFQAIPPAGRLPKATINPADFTQTFFPPEIDVDLSIIPEDEVLAMIEESLLLPPIDLTVEGDDLLSTSVLVLIPIQRSRLREVKTRLETTNTENPLSRTLRPAAPGRLAKRLPLETLIRIPRFGIQLPAPPDPVTATWRSELSNAPVLWYVRRRNLNYKVGVAGTQLSVTPITPINETEMINRFREINLNDRLIKIRKPLAVDTNLELTALLSSARVTESKLLMNAALTEFETAKEESPEKLNKPSVITVGARFSQPQLGEGLKRLEALDDSFKDDATITTLAQSGKVPELDEAARHLRDEDLRVFAKELSKLAKAGKVEESGELIKRRLTELKGIPR